MKKILISSQNISMTAGLNDSETAQKIWEALPFEGSANTWGDEIYFEVPFEISEAPDACTEVEVGTLGYWPAGDAFCIFFGPTPASQGEKPCAASPVNVFGAILGDATVFRAVQDGETVQVRASEES